MSIYRSVLFTVWCTTRFFVSVQAIDLSLSESFLDLDQNSPLRIDSADSAPVQYFDQLIDHKTNQIFKQRYYVNDTFYKLGGPAFLYLGGEGVNQPYTVSRTLVSELAKRHNGILYSLEHRYYGKSHPFNDTSAHSLRFLSSEYALKDIARFAKLVKSTKFNKTHPKWYVLGYSYSGMLAAWSRQMHPELFDGALSSSAPVQAKEDFYEYDQVVHASLGPKCGDVIQRAVDTIDIMYKSNSTQFKSLKDKAGCQRLPDIYFMSTIYDAVSHVVQYNKPGSKLSTEYLCSSLSEKSGDKLVNQLLETFQVILSNLKETCLSFSGLPKFQNYKVDEKEATRQWTYQCCKEFGFWQTAPTTSCHLRSKYITTNWFNQFYCSKNFFPPSSQIGPPQVDKVNQLHHGRNLNVSRVIFTNGDNDPWSALSISNPSRSRPDRPVILIEKGAHCSDLLVPDKATNSPSLTKAYDTIFKTFQSWIC